MIYRCLLRGPWRPTGTLLALLVLLVAAPARAGEPGPASDQSPHAPATPLTPLDQLPWPAGTQVTDFENIEGIILFDASVSSANGTDSSGTFVFDTGAGYLVLDHGLAHRLALTDDPEPPIDIAVVQRPLRRLSIGSLQIDHVTPLLTFRGEIVSRATDRAVLGLMGQRLLTGRAVWIDYAEERFAIVPVPQGGRRRFSENDRIEVSRTYFEKMLSPRATGIPFRIPNDAKILVRGRVSDSAPPDYSDELTLVVDTGAAWSVVSEDALRRHVRNERKWQTLEGYTAPTVFGDETARVARVPRAEVLGGGAVVGRDDVDTAILGDGLFERLSAGIGERIDGIVGATFLQNYRVGIDYVNRVMWLDPMPEGWENRPYRDSTIGIQIERIAGEIQIEAVLEDTPADEAGLRVGDTIVSVDGRPATDFDILAMNRAFEGPPGSQVDLTVRRGTSTRTYVIVRRNLF